MLIVIFWYFPKIFYYSLHKATDKRNFSLYFKIFLSKIIFYLLWLLFYPHHPNAHLHSWSFNVTLSSQLIDVAMDLLVGFIHLRYLGFLRIRWSLGTFWCPHRCFAGEFFLTHRIRKVTIQSPHSSILLTFFCVLRKDNRNLDRVVLRLKVDSFP